MHLTCIECERESDEVARGWQAHLGYDDEGEDEVVFYCPLCASREFGESTFSV